MEWGKAGDSRKEERSPKQGKAEKERNKPAGKEATGKALFLETEGKSAHKSSIIKLFYRWRRIKKY